MRQTIALSIMFLFFLTNSYGQKAYIPQFSDPILNKFRWRHCEELNGKNFRCFCEGENGVMWFGVENGVISYDGYNWIEYPIPQEKRGIGDIRAMVCLGDTVFIGGLGIQKLINGNWGNLEHKIKKNQRFSDMRSGGRVLFRDLIVSNDVVIGARTSGLYVRKNGREHFYTNEIIKQRLDTIFTDLKFHVVNCFGDGTQIFCSSVLDCGDNTYYAFCIGVYGMKRHVKFKLNDNDKNPLEIIEENRETDISIGGPSASIRRPNGEIWLVSEAYDQGLNILRNDEWEVFSFKDNLDDTDVSWNIINLSDGSVLITSLGVIYRFYKNQWSKITAPDIPFKSIHLYAAYTKNGDLWLGDENGEVYKIDYSTKHYTTYENLNYQVTNSDGSLWFISNDNKVVYKKNNTWFYYDETDGLPSEPQTLYATKNGSVWCGGSHNQVAATAFLNNNKWIKQIHDSLSWSVNSNAVVEGLDGDVWFSGAADLKSKKGQVGGIVKIKSDGNNAKVAPYCIDRPIFNSFVQANDDGLYAGTEKGLYSFTENQLNSDKPENRITLLMGENVSFNRILKSRTGTLWAATSGAGVIKYFEEEAMLFTQDDGLASNVIIDIYLTTDTSVWVATNKGYSYYNGQYWNNDIYPQEFNIGTESGKLSGHNENIWISKFPLKWTRRVYEMNDDAFAMQNFFSVMYVRDTMPPETQIAFFHPKVDASGNTNIQWTGIDYMRHTTKEKLLYSYRLNSHEWSIPNKATNINFSKLKSGAYVFEVKACDKDMNFDPTPAAITFTVTPPVRKQAWFIFMVTGFVAIILFMAARIIVRDNNLTVANKEIIQQSAQLSEAKTLLEKHHEEILAKNEEVHQFKLQFFTNISHEFRTPLSLIMAPVEELSEDSNLNKKQKYLFSTIQRNVKNLLNLVNQLMDFRKIENNKLELKVSKGNLLEIINNVASDFNLQAKNQNIKLSISSNEVVDSVHWFDHRIIERVLINLLSNAFKFTPKEGRIKISVYRKGDMANISVSDTGRGISKDQIDLVFERFYSDSTGSNQLSSGTGIGLAMCKRLIEVHKGNISIESEEKKGTTFNIELPVSKDNYSADEIVPISSHQIISNDIITDNYSNENVIENSNWEYSKTTDENILMLIVEDNNELRDYLTKHFGYYKIRSACNGIEAFDIANETIPDIIISDLMMPEMDGLQLCHKIKTTYLTSHIPLILLTAKTQIENQIEGLETGADAYISKPFNLQHLEIQVQNLIQQRKILREKFSVNSDIKFADIAINNSDVEFYNKVEKVITENMTDPDFMVDDLALSLCFSRSQLFRKFKAITNNSPSEFIRIKRLNFSAELISLKKFTISEVAYGSGFSNPGHFIAAFKKHFGKTPKEYEKNL